MPEMRVVASVGTHPAVVVVEHPVLGPLLGGGGGAAGGTSATAREVIAARARGAARERLLGVVLVSGSLSTHRTCHRDARAILECVGPDVSPDAMRSSEESDDDELSSNCRNELVRTTTASDEIEAESLSRCVDEILL